MSTNTFSLSDLRPSDAIHPGEIVKDELENRGISQRKFAGIIGCSYTVLNEILNAKRPINTDYALRIEAALGIKAYMLINLQTEYNLQIESKDSALSSLLYKIRSAAAML